MSTTRRNRNHDLHWRFDVIDPETGQVTESVHEKCRNSIGGFSNMVGRIERRWACRVRILDDHRFEAGPRQGTITELVKVAPGQFAEVS